MTVIHAAERFTMPRAAAISADFVHRFLMDRCLEMRVMLVPEGRSMMMGDAPLSVFHRTMPFIIGAMQHPQAALAWGIEYNTELCSFAGLFYDPAYLESVGTVPTPARFHEFQHGDEWLQVSFVPMATPDDVLAATWELMP